MSRATSMPSTSSWCTPKNIMASGSTSTTMSVRVRASTAAPHSHLFCPFIWKSDRRRLRMLKQWKISTMLSVMNAIMTPFSSTSETMPAPSAPKSMVPVNM